MQYEMVTPMEVCPIPVIFFWFLSLKTTLHCLSKAQLACSLVPAFFPQTMATLLIFKFTHTSLLQNSICKGAVCSPFKFQQQMISASTRNKYLSTSTSQPDLSLIFQKWGKLREQLLELNLTSTNS